MKPLNELTDEQRNRVEYFQNVAADVSNLISSLGMLLEPVEESDGVDVVTLREVLGFWDEILGSQAVMASYVLAPPNESPFFVNDALLHDVQVQLQIIKGYLAKLSDLRMVDHHVETLYSELLAALRRAKQSNVHFVSEDELAALNAVISSLASRVDLVEKRRELNDFQERVISAVATAETSASVASSAAGIAGDAAMSAYYKTLAESEHGSANLFRWLTTFLSLVAGGVAAGFVLGPGVGMTWLNIESGDFVHLIQRGLLVGGVFALAGYFARQAHQHRSMGNWAGSLAVQLQTFEAYLSPIDDREVKNELRKSFAARVFGDHPAMKGEPITPSSDSSDKLLDVAARIVGKQTQ